MVISHSLSIFSLLLKPREPVDSDEGVADADVGALVGGAGDDPVPDAHDHARVPPGQVRGPGSRYCLASALIRQLTRS